MRELNKKELTLLGKELKMAKVAVLYKWGFSSSEIAAITGISESVIRNLINKLSEN